MSTWECWRNPSHPVAPHPRFGWPQCQYCQAAPQYHERAAWLPSDLALRVYVPRLPALRIAPGSAVVGLTVMSDLVQIYYEGWVHGAMQYADRDARGRWEAGLQHAADRMVTGYPTAAQALVGHLDVHRVGTYNPTTHDITITDEAALAAWLEETP